MHVVTSRQTWGRCLISPITGGAGETNDGLSDSERITGDTGSRCGWRQVTTDAPKQPDRIFRESYLVIWNHWGGSLRARTSVNISTGVCGGQVGGRCTCWSWRGGGTVGRAVGVWLLQEVTVEAALTWSTQRHTAHTNDGRSMGGGRGGDTKQHNNTLDQNQNQNQGSNYDKGSFYTEKTLLPHAGELKRTETEIMFQ